MDSITQIVLGAAVAEAVAGKKMGGKAALWGALAGTIPDLDVFLRGFYHPIDAALIHRGFSHSLVFACLAGPILGWIFFRLYKRKYELKTWMLLFFLGIVTHPMLDMFTNYGTEFLWPFSTRITFNSVFVVDPLYTIPFMILLIIALFHKRTNPRRYKINMAGIIYSSMYLLWGVVVKLVLLSSSTGYFTENGYKPSNTLVTPMPLTSFYWMMLTEDNKNYYVGYKSLFYAFNPKEIDTIPKDKKTLYTLKWKGTNYAKKLDFISNGYYTTIRKDGSLMYYDIRFGTPSQLTNREVRMPMMGYQFVLDKNNTVLEEKQDRPSNMMKHVDFWGYIHRIYSAPGK